MLSRVFKQMKNPGHRGPNSNAVSPHDKYSDGTVERRNHKLRGSKSYGDLKGDMKPFVYTLPDQIGNVEYKVEANIRKRWDVRSDDDIPRGILMTKPKQYGKVEVNDTHLEFDTTRPRTYIDDTSSEITLTKPKQHANAKLEVDDTSSEISMAKPKQYGKVDMDDNDISQAITTKPKAETDDTPREITTTKPERASKVDVDYTLRDTSTIKSKHSGRSASRSSKKTKRLTKRDARSIVLGKFEVLASKNVHFKSFLETYPEYLETLEMDELRVLEYARLDKLGQIYLDYTGGSLYPESLITLHTDILTKGVFGNPHSSNPTSSASTAYEVKVRQDILEFFNADPKEYDVVLTNNASGALKLVGESYPFSPTRKLLLTWDAHNSVNGIREFAKQKDSEVIYIKVDKGDVRVNKELLKENLDRGRNSKENPGMFILTGQSNVTGVKADLAWVNYAKSRGWDVLLDASALAPTTPIDLSKYPVDFMAISFYKMFGYPTGVGCLIMRHETAAKLQRPWFGGGTVDLVAVPHDARTLAPGHRRFEDGTLNYLSLSAVSLGLAFLRPIQKTLLNRISILINYLIKELSSLHHESTGKQLVHVTGPKTTHLRGGTISFYLTDAEGSFIPHLLVEDLAKKRNISLRAGCMCNPGAMTTAIDQVEHLDHLKHDISIDEFLDSFDEELVLLQRISIGIATNWEDCHAFVNFCREFLDPVVYAEVKKEFGHVRLTSLC